MLTRFASSFAGSIGAIACGLCFVLAMPPAAQAQDAPDRLVPIPPKAKRAEMVFDTTQFVQVDGKTMQLAPGVRIFGTDNMIKLYGSLQGKGKTKYLAEPTTGLLQYIWILTDKEIATPDPKQ